jgi:hypothetical protein
MKKYKFIALSVILLCIAGLNIYGQKKEISKEEFFDAYKKTSKKAATYRIIGRTETYRNNKLKSIINETSEFVLLDIFSYLKDKRWISRDGFLLKMELEDELAGLPGNWSRRTWTYEYDPNIKIESPVLENKAKL